MFRTLALALALALAAALAPAAPAKAEPLRMGILPVLDTLPLQVAAAEGLFAAQGLEVELVPFASALERDTAMQSGRLDGYFGDLVATLLLMQAGAPLRIVTVSWSSSPGQRMFAIVRAPKAAQTAHPGIGISRSTIMEHLLDEMARAKGLPLADWSVVEVKNIPIRMQMLLTSQLDMALLPEPLVSLAQARGAAVAATDEDLGMVLTVVCISQDRLVPGVGEAFLRAYDRAVAALAAEPERFRELMARACRIPPDLAAVFPVYAYPFSRLPSPAEVDRVQDWMLAKGLLDARLPYAGMIPETR